MQLTQWHTLKMGLNIHHMNLMQNTGKLGRLYLLKGAQYLQFWDLGYLTEVMIGQLFCIF
jgi:hypothetical protein